jgi:hypothetical protein
MTSLEHERRKEPRSILQIPILVSETRTGRKIPGVTRDASPRGVFLYVDHWPADALKVEFRMILPAIGSSKAMHALCKGTVVRVEEGAPDGKIGVALTLDSYSLDLNSTAPS